MVDPDRCSQGQVKTRRFARSGGWPALHGDRVRPNPDEIAPTPDRTDPARRRLCPSESARLKKCTKQWQARSSRRHLEPLDFRHRVASARKNGHAVVRFTSRTACNGQLSIIGWPRAPTASHAGFSRLHNNDFLKKSARMQMAFRGSKLAGNWQLVTGPPRHTQESRKRQACASRRLQRC